MIGSLCSSGLRAAIVIPERPRGSGDGASHLVLGEYGRLDRAVGAGECLLSALSAVGSAHAVAADQCELHSPAGSGIEAHAQAQR